VRLSWKAAEVRRGTELRILLGDELDELSWFSRKHKEEQWLGEFTSIYDMCCSYFTEKLSGCNWFDQPAMTLFQRKLGNYHRKTWFLLTRKIQRQNQLINNRWTNKNGAINQLNNQSINSKWICNQQKLRDWVAAGNSETQTISMPSTMTAQMNLEGGGHPEKKFQALDSYLKFLMHLKHSHRYSIAFSCSLN
jgi:hypothetical protein